ncbi:MAG: hypothetical protein WC222_08570 [Parachlamydiales bacterium]|jgi:hypothetical protein
MSPVPKHKLCWQCEGNIDFTQDHCPYCGVYLNVESNFAAASEEHTFTPPYRLPNIQENESGDNANVEAIQPGIIDYLKPLLLLLLGSTLSIFALMLYLFSSNGVLTLQWNADVWYLYLVISVPLLWAGWRALNHADLDP